MKLTEKQKRFADAYVELGNATQAAIEAGYSKKTARSIGQQNLTKLDIKNYIETAMNKIKSDRVMGATEAVELLTSIARGELIETVVAGELTVDKPPDAKTRMAAAKEILKRYPASDRMLNAQIRKLEAEADIVEAKAREFNDTDNNGLIIEIKRGDRRELPDEDNS